MKTSTVVLSITASAFISNAITVEQTIFDIFSPCPAIDAKGPFFNNVGEKLFFSPLEPGDSHEKLDRQSCDPQLLSQDSSSICDCRVSEFDKAAETMRCDVVCYELEPDIGDACPTDDKKNNGWTIKKEGCLPNQSCLVSELHHVLDQSQSDPREILLDIICKTPMGTVIPEPTDDYTASPTPTPKPTKPSCEHKAYDNHYYCKCPAPKPVPNGIEVSVCGDATYVLSKDNKPCSGPTSAEPAGTACPKRGETTSIHCRKEVMSYISEDNCVAPEDATCAKLLTGAWGCVFPGNCNGVNECEDKNPAKRVTPCHAGYRKTADGTCKMNDNGYPIPEANHTVTVDTSKFPKLERYTAGENGASGLAVTSVSILMSVTAFLLAFH